MAAGNGHGEKISRMQERAIGALLCHDTVGAAAKAAGVSETTLGRWLRLAAFQAAYRAARQDAVREAVVDLQRASGAAVRTLVAVMDDAAAPASARVAAARSVLEGALRATELEELQERVSGLERQIAELG